MNSRSTAAPRLKVSTGASIMAVAAFSALATDALASDAVVARRADASETTTAWEGKEDFNPINVQSASIKTTYQTADVWDEAKHKSELSSLIIKKASCGKDFNAKDARRLAALQQMRRETLPQPMSYEEFVREQDRKEELVKLTEALMAYERKYGAVVNG